MGLELTTDKYPPITSQTRYPLRHAVIGPFIAAVYDGDWFIFRFADTVVTDNKAEITFKSAR